MGLTTLFARLRRFRAAAQLDNSRGEMQDQIERQQILVGQLLAEQNSERSPTRLADVQFRVFSQWGDDGIIQWLIRHVNPLPETFIEFGVEDYREANTRFLLINNNWRGLIMDGSVAWMHAVNESPLAWRHDLTAQAAFVTAENINELLESRGFTGEVGLLHIDIDGNDFWVWKAISVIEPIIVIVEYNAVFGSVRPITVPYSPGFRRFEAHPSGLYAGASLPALRWLAEQKGYVFVGCNGAGNNAYFVRRDRIAGRLQLLAASAAFVDSRFRESRDPSGHFTFLAGAARAEVLKGLTVVNVAEDRSESF